MERGAKEELSYSKAFNEVLAEARLPSSWKMLDAAIVPEEGQNTRAPVLAPPKLHKQGGSFPCLRRWFLLSLH